MQGVLEKGDGYVRGVGDSLGATVQWAVLRRWTTFLSQGVRGLDGCYVGHRLESKAGRLEGTGLD